MKTSLIILLAIVVCLGCTGSVFASPIPAPLEGPIVIPATNSSGVTSSATLNAGQVYWILAEGTYVQAYNGLVADAEWNEQSAPDPWFEEHGGGGTVPVYNHDILIDGAYYDWWGSSLVNPDPIADFDTFAPHVFSPSHKYWVPIIGTGSTIQLSIYDVEYVDNTGSLTGHIYVPEPTTMALLSLSGLAMFLRKRK